MSLVGLFINPAQFFQSYLTAYMFVLGATLGCLALGMIHQLSGGAWGVVTRRPIGAASRVLPVLTLLFLPIVFGIRHLYEWTHADVVAADEILRGKQLYLNTPFFLARAAVYFAVWNALAYFLNKWSLEQDRTGDPRIARRMQLLSGGGLARLRPDGHLRRVRLDDVARAALVLDDLRRADHGRPGPDRAGVPDRRAGVAEPPPAARRHRRARALPRSREPDARVRDAVGVLLVLAVPDHLVGQPARGDHAGTCTACTTAGGSSASALVVFHFAVPFVLLLSRAVKREPDDRLKVAVGILVARLVDLFWLIAPEFHARRLSVSWMDVVVPLTLVALWLGCFIWQLRGRAILPVHDPQFEEALGRSSKAARRAAGRPDSSRHDADTLDGHAAVHHEESDVDIPCDLRIRRPACVIVAAGHSRGDWLMFGYLRPAAKPQVPGNCIRSPPARR